MSHCRSSVFLLIIRLVKDYDIAFVSTGDVLRKEIMAKSEVGKRAEEVVASGGESKLFFQSEQMS